MENDYLIRQKPFRALLVFALPMILGNLFQQTYTLMDSAIVGRYVGEQALAAVGASYALTNIFICIAIGGGTYVHDIAGGVAFGMEYPDWNYHMHGDDEFLPLKQLEENTCMMAAAILRICGE